MPARGSAEIQEKLRYYLIDTSDFTQSAPMRLSYSSLFRTVLPMGSCGAFLSLHNTYCSASISQNSGIDCYVSS
jgi:hypothetical protein